MPDDNSSNLKSNLSSEFEAALSGSSITLPATASSNQLSIKPQTPSLELSKLASDIEKLAGGVEKINNLVVLGFFVILIMTLTLAFMFGTILYQSWWEKEKSYTELMKRVDALQTELIIQKHEIDSY